VWEQVVGSNGARVARGKQTSAWQWRLQIKMPSVPGQPRSKSTVKPSLTLQVLL
jgi:hypothetical protein